MSRPQKTHKNVKNEIVNTREALLEAVLKLVKDDRSFDAISLREVTRSVGITPAAFYRHFPTMESLGLELVDSAFARIRLSLLEARRESDSMMTPVAARSFEALMQFFEENPLHFRFILREYNGGTQILREAIEEGLLETTNDLIPDLARLPELEHLNRKSLAMVGELIMWVMLRVFHEILNFHDNKRKRAEILNRGVKKIQLIILGAREWDETRHLSNKKPKK